jgi:glycosyltransferase involved in cell wall biosynthesis
MAKIVHFGKYYFPDPGGIESVTLSLSLGAVQFGHSVLVVCFRKSMPESGERTEGVTVWRTPIDTIIASQPLGIKYVFACWKASKNADIIHLHAPNMLAALCVLFVNRKTQLLVHWHSDVINKGILGKILRPLESVLLSRANVIVAATLAYADSSTTLARFRSKVTVVPYGTKKNNNFRTGSELTQPILDKIKGKKIVLAVGRLVAYKGFRVLINAAQHLCDGSIVLIVGAGSLKNDLQQKIENAGVSERVLLAGKLSESELHSLFERATLFCLPSVNRAEAFGMVLIEALSYGLPIVASTIPGSGVPWVNQHGVTGLNVKIGDHIALAEACNQILTSPELRSDMSQGSFKRYADEFTEKVSINRMMRVYDQMLSF